MAGLTLDSVHELAKTVPETVFMTFQLTFAIITPALIAGAFAERDEVLGHDGVSWRLWSLMVYLARSPLGVGRRLPRDWGVLDFAGGTVVHINAGVAGLVWRSSLGKRMGYGIDEHGAAQPGLLGDRRRPPVGRLVRLQRRLRGRRQPQRRHGDGGDAVRHGRGGLWPGCSRSG